MRYTVLTCEALARSVYSTAANTPAAITVRLFSQGLHNTPKKLRDILQDAVDTIEPGQADAILLAYGLCGRSTDGLIARHTPIVIPRAHDCITLYLGSRQLYAAEFEAHPGTYWYSVDYMERSDGKTALGAGSIGVMDDVYEEYVEKYGQDNADYLMEVMGEWGSHYDRAAFIDMGHADPGQFEEQARDQASRRGWTYERLTGNQRLIDRLLQGQWTDDEFITVQPGHVLRQSGTEGIFTTEKVMETDD